MDIPIQDDLALSNLTLCDFTLGNATLGNFIPVICVHPTVILGKGFGSKGKQYHKHTALETQSHTQWSQEMPRIDIKYFQSS